MEDAVETGIISGRDGMGTVFVWAAGNERQELGHHANYNNVVNSRYTIAVAAIDGHGVSAPIVIKGLICWCPPLVMEIRVRDVLGRLSPLI